MYLDNNLVSLRFRATPGVYLPTPGVSKMLCKLAHAKPVNTDAVKVMGAHVLLNKENSIHLCGLLANNVKVANV